MFALEQNSFPKSFSGVTKEDGQHEVMREDRSIYSSFTRRLSFFILNLRTASWQMYCLLLNEDTYRKVFAVCRSKTCYMGGRQFVFQSVVVCNLNLNCCLFWQKEEKDKPVERRPFDRDQDLNLPKMSDGQKKSVIQKSKELGSRFHHSRSGSSFL